MGSKLINYMLTANEKIEPGVDLVQFNQDNHDSYKVKLDNFLADMRDGSKASEVDNAYD